MSFGDRLAARVADRQSQIVLGLDPDPARLWRDAVATAPASGSPAERAAAAVRAHCAALVEGALDNAGVTGTQAVEDVA